MPQVLDPVRIPVPGDKVIGEHVGRVATDTAEVSVAFMVAPPGWDEPHQTPQFDEITVVVRGEVHLEYEGGLLVARAGQSLLARAGERVRYSVGPDGAEYVAVCVPAFTPAAAHREDVG